MILTSTHENTHTMRTHDIFAPQTKRTNPKFRLDDKREDKRAHEMRRRDARRARQAARGAQA